MNRFITIALMLVSTQMIGAQNIDVSSFRLLENDLDANTIGTLEKDQNGEIAALIKVVTTETGFSFDTGQLGIVKTVQKPAEIWVYVPHGMKKITISHPRLGILRDYYLPITVAPARTYEMVLEAGTHMASVRQTQTSQFVVFQLTPAYAVVDLDGEALETIDGTATKKMKFGSYNYRVQAPNYLSEAGNITVNDIENKHIININLKPNFASVKLTTESDAEIWLNGELKGTGSWTGILSAGTYDFETRKKNHRTITTTCDIIPSSNVQTITLQAPTPIYGEVKINSSPRMAEIYIDYKKVGQTPQMVSKLTIGQHLVRICKQGFMDYKSTIMVKGGDTIMFSKHLEKDVIGSTIEDPLSASASANKVFTIGNVSFTMVRVDGGTFPMGVTYGQDLHPDLFNRLPAIPVHQVTLSPYYIGETEVTQALWEAVMGNNPSKFKGNNQPVEQVNWEDCQIFISKVNNKTGLKFRMPTEAEWEFAARGGNKSQGYVFCGSDNISEVAWCADDQTHDVKTKKANELGIYDMSGNVSEWCQDWYGDYSVGSQTNPIGPSSGSKRVVRGSCWYRDAWFCPVAERRISPPSLRSMLTGLRLVLEQ